MSERTPRARLEAIRQEHTMACGLACIAFVTRKKYQEISAGEPAEKLNELGYMCYELVELLHRHGNAYNWRAVVAGEDAEKFEAGSIVYTGQLPDMPEGHYLVKTEHGWMDPWLNFNPHTQDPTEAEAGYRESLPGKAEFVIYPLA